MINIQAKNIAVKRIIKLHHLLKYNCIFVLFIIDCYYIILQIVIIYCIILHIIIILI